MAAQFSLTTLLILTAPVLCYGQGGIITSVAGSSHCCFSGDGGPANDADLNQPIAVALDGAGNLYIADYGNNRVRKVNAAGVINTIAGNGAAEFSGDGGPATSAGLRLPYGLAPDSQGNLYIADYLNYRIRKVDKNGIITTVAGNGTRGFGGDGGPATSAEFIDPAAVVVDKTGTLYIADTHNFRIRKVTPDGTINTVAGGGTLTPGDGGPGTSAHLYGPYGLALDKQGNLYIADLGNRIRKLDASGTITTVAGNGSTGFAGDGGPATSASLASPEGVAVDGAGNIYIADSFNNRVRKVDTAGIITTIAGGHIGAIGDGGPATDANVGLPTGVAVDTIGNVYIADNAHELIRKVSAAPVTPTVTAVVNGASFLPGIAPSTWITIQGAGFSKTTRSWKASDFINGNLPAGLDGVTVKVNGKPAYVYYISPTQLNVLSPDDTTTGEIRVQVSNASGASNSFSVNTAPLSPAFFLLTEKYPAAVHTSGVLVGKPGLIAGAKSTPAKLGETILLYGTGFGLTDPFLPAGKLVTKAARLAGNVVVTVGGQPAHVSFAGLTGSGLDQLNVTIPAGLADGDAPLAATIGGVVAPTNLSITVQH